MRLNIYFGLKKLSLGTRNFSKGSQTGSANPDLSASLNCQHLKKFGMERERSFRSDSFLFVRSFSVLNSKKFEL